MTNLPSSPDEEKAVLSCALQWTESFDKVAAHPSGSDLFYTPAYREIWETMLSMHRSGAKPDLVTLTGALRAADRLDSVGGAQMIADLATDAPTPKMLKQYLKAVSDSTRRRRLISECHDIAADAFDVSRDLDTLIQRSDTAIQELLKTASNAKARAWNEVLGKTVQMIDDARNAGGVLPGLSTGFESLDNATNGYQGGQLWIVAARPGAGKTAMLLNLVENLVKESHPTSIFSAEMYAEELAVRSLSGQSKVDSLRLARGDISKTEFPRLQNAIGKCSSWPLWIDDRADMRLIDIQVGARKLVKERGVKVVYVDYLQLIKEPDGSRTREDAVRRLSDGMKQLAKELGITVVALAQLNRSNEKRESKRPQMSDLRDSGSIEQDANVILLLNPLEPDSKEPVVDVELIVAKCRGGKLGPIAFEFDKPTTTFYPKDHE
jgi:replicative DNA helicase